MHEIFDKYQLFIPTVPLFSYKDLTMSGVGFNKIVCNLTKIISNCLCLIVWGF